MYVPVPQGKVLGASENVSLQEFATVQQLADVQQQINALSRSPQTVFVPSFSGPAATTPVSVATFAQGQRIDNLSGTNLSNITVSGVSGLTAADIPALSYMPLNGGAISGNVTLDSLLSLASSTIGDGTRAGGLDYQWRCDDDRHRILCRPSWYRDSESDILESIRCKRNNRS